MRPIRLTVISHDLQKNLTYISFQVKGCLLVDASLFFLLLPFLLWPYCLVYGIYAGEE